MKIRLDKLVVDLGLAASRERAQALILAGRVLVGEQKIDKPGTSVDAEAEVRLKLEGALKHWAIDLAGVACLDIGASTGGFTDCMLQHGAASVLAVDTGYGQIAQKLRDDERVSLRERCNARLLAAGELVAEAKGATFLAMDVSFISATLVLPAVLKAIVPEGEAWVGTAVLLVKPQFEAGREAVGKGGIVRTAEARQFAIDRVHDCVLANGGHHTAIIDSPIHGMEGNHEYLLYARFGERQL